MCPILPTTPNAVLQRHHDRRPVILPRDTYNARLNLTVGDVETVQALLTPYPADTLTASPVSPRGNNPADDAPECIAAAT